MHLQKRLATAASLLAVTCAELLCAHGASAADLTVTAYGGSWEQAYKQCFVQPFEKKTGKTVAVILGNPMQWMNQIAANPSKPPIDVIVGLADSAEIARQRGLVDPISAKDIPNLTQIKPKLLDLDLDKGYGFPIAYGNMGLMYSKKRVPNPPKTWKDFVEGTVNGKWQAAIPGISYVGTPAGLIALFAHIYGGSLENAQPGFAQIKRMADSGNVTFYSEPNSPLVALKSGDIDMAMYYDGRAWTEHDTNNPDIGFIYPKPGAVPLPTMVQRVKNSSPLSLPFMNEIASVEGQTCFANKIQYFASNMNVQYTEPLKSRVPTDADTLWLSFGDMSRLTPKWVEMWNKEIGR